MSYGPPPGQQPPGGYGPPPGGYTPPPGGYGPPPPGYPGGQPPPGKPDNWLWAAIVSIASLVLCCNPLALIFGVIALVFSLQVDSNWNAGNFAGAEDAANKAKIFGIIGVVLTVLSIFFWIAWFLFVAGV
ncbi:CD225/dispanin family protein [Salinactinospora qingdaonensis]|uniref:Interferon-induced transmembrane protein n=1 Tax=Salinactinospora qingdaonensis TaxID=702744 RepID=A0ABP7FSW9_9ACTN